MICSGEETSAFEKISNSTRLAVGAATEKFTPTGVIVLPSGQGLPRWIVRKDPPADRRTYFTQSRGCDGPPPK